MAQTFTKVGLDALLTPENCVHQPSPSENSMSNKLDGLALDQLFRTARTRNGWTDRPVTEEQLRELYDLMKFGPTSSNSCPARFVWIRSAEAKGRLAALDVRGGFAPWRNFRK